jgi:uncharacterized membrane-anchored protein
MSRLKLVFILLFLIQIAVPLTMILEKESVLNKGETVYFQVQPVDPYDAFRGKYLSIGIMENRVDIDTLDYKDGQDIFARLSVDSDGFGKPVGLSTEPYLNELYVKCKIDYVDDNAVTLIFPFDRYYINEEYSQSGEELYNQFSNGEKEDAYISVRIRKGKAVLEEMYLSGIEINEFIKAELQNKQ